MVFLLFGACRALWLSIVACRADDGGVQSSPFSVRRAEIFREWSERSNSGPTSDAPRSWGNDVVGDRPRAPGCIAHGAAVGVQWQTFKHECLIPLERLFDAASDINAGEARPSESDGACVTAS